MFSSSRKTPAMKHQAHSNTQDNENDILFRAYEKKDYQDLADLITSVFGPGLDQESFEKEYCQKDKRILLAITNGKTVQRVVGFAIYQKRTDQIKKIQSMFVLYAGIKDEFRKRGIGRLLFQEIESIAKEQGCTCVELTSANHRIDAHEFYSHIGFSRKKTTVFIKELS